MYSGSLYHSNRLTSIYLRPPEHVDHHDSPRHRPRTGDRRRRRLRNDESQKGPTRIKAPEERRLLEPPPKASTPAASDYHELRKVQPVELTAHVSDRGVNRVRFALLNAWADSGRKAFWGREPLRQACRAISTLPNTSHLLKFSIPSHLHCRVDR